MKKILFISYDGMTDPLGQSQVIPYLQGLSKKGFRFHLLSCEKPGLFEKNKEAVKKMLDGHSIEWHPIPYTKKPAVLSTIKDILLLRKKAIQIHRQYGMDMVHTRPGIPALIGQMMKKKFAVKFLHDIREFYADSRVEGGIWNINNPLFKAIYNYFKRQEQQQIKVCDGIVCLTHAAEKIVTKLPGYKKETPLQVIPCSVDLAIFNPSAINEQSSKQIKKELGISENDFVLSYLGSIGGWYMTNEMMRFCKLLSDTKPGAKFLFITPHLHEVIAAEAARHGIPAHQLIVKQATRNEVPLLLSLSHYSLFFIKPCYSKLSSSPTKHGEIMAMGIPVITNSGVGDVKGIVEKYQSGYLVDNFEEAAIQEAIAKMLKENAIDKARIRAGAEAFYALSNAIESYHGLYKKLLQ